MNKSRALELHGGTITGAAEAINISYQAVDKWPDVLPPRIADRVLAAWIRREFPELANAAETSKTQNPIERVDESLFSSRR